MLKPFRRHGFSSLWLLVSWARELGLGTQASCHPCRRRGLLLQRLFGRDPKMLDFIWRLISSMDFNAYHRPNFEVNSKSETDWTNA